MSAAQLAKLAGVSRQTVHAIEAGDYVPNTALALQLAQFLEARVEDLFSLEQAAVAPKPVTVDLIGPAEPLRKGQPVRICRVGKQLIGVSAGSHLRDSLSGEYNLPAIKRLFPKGEVKVVTFAIWEQGFVVPSGNPKHIRGAADLARKDVCIMNREKGAGSRDLLDQKLREAG